MEPSNVVELYDKVKVGAKVLATWKQYQAKPINKEPSDQLANIFAPHN